jgi:hypothetical protein
MSQPALRSIDIMKLEHLRDRGLQIQAARPNFSPRRARGRSPAYIKPIDFGVLSFRASCDPSSLLPILSRQLVLEPVALARQRLDVHPPPPSSSVSG